MIRDGEPNEKEVGHMLLFLMLTGYRVKAVEKLHFGHYCYKGRLEDPPANLEFFWYGESKQKDREFIRSYPVNTFRSLKTLLQIKNLDKLSRLDNRDKYKFFRFKADYMGQVFREFRRDSTHPLAKKMKNLKPMTLRKVYANNFVSQYIQQVELV